MRYKVIKENKPTLTTYGKYKAKVFHNGEVSSKYAKAHEDWRCLLITYDEEDTEEGIPVVPVWKWLMEV